MIIGIPKETFPNESRVALLPSEIKQLTSNNILFQIEPGAGNGAFFTDESYKDSGANVISNVYEKSTSALNDLSIHSRVPVLSPSLSDHDLIFSGLANEIFILLNFFSATSVLKSFEISCLIINLNLYLILVI